MYSTLPAVVRDRAGMRADASIPQANPPKGGDAKPPVYGNFLGQRGCQLADALLQGSGNGA